MSALELYADVRGALMGDAVLDTLVTGIYADAAPESADYPFVVIELAQVAEVPFLGNGAPIERVVVVTRVVDTDLERMSRVRERIDDVMASLASGDAGQMVAVRKTSQRVEARIGQGTIERIDTAEHEFLLVPAGTR
jgi:hypothetical protein